MISSTVPSGQRKCCQHVSPACWAAPMNSTPAESISADSVEVADAQAHHWPGGEERVEFIGRPVDLKHRAVAQPEPGHASGFSGERHADDVPKQPDHLAELVATQPHEVHPFYCHSHSFGQQCGENGPMIVGRVVRDAH
jgi:hypothetical protein